jgi:hypothetical protein
MATTLEASLEDSLWTLSQLHATLAVSESDARPQCRCTHSLQSIVDTPGAVARAELPLRSDTCPSELNRGTSRSLHTASADPSFPATTTAITNPALNLGYLESTRPTITKQISYLTDHV